MQLIGTAGHIDHGKSTLIQALTGVHPSRLPEEKKRGMTIDLGYAYLKHNNETIGFIDVPGHEKLIKNMTAGATGIGIALLVVDSHEGPRQQTKEHLNIIQLLGVKNVIPVLTKIQDCDPASLQKSEQQLQDIIQNSLLTSTRVFQVDSLTKTGVPDLKQAIFDLSNKLKSDKNKLPIYMPIDRSFQIKGLGAIVTGTLFQGTIKKDQKVKISGISEPIRIKSIHNHNQEVDEIESGHRVGLQPAGISSKQIKRGQVIMDPDYIQVTRSINVHLKLLPDSPLDMKSGTQFLFYTGTSESTCKIFITHDSPKPSSPNKLQKGQSCYAQISLEKEIPFYFRQPFLIRSTFPLVTIAGGTVLDCLPDQKRKITLAENSFYTRVPGINDGLKEYVIQSQSKSVSLERLKLKFLLTSKTILEFFRGDPRFIIDADPHTPDSAAYITTMDKLAEARSQLKEAIQGSNHTLKNSWSYSEVSQLTGFPQSLWKAVARTHNEALSITRNQNVSELVFLPDGIQLHPSALSLSKEEILVKGKLIERLKKEGVQTTFYPNFKKHFAGQLKPFNQVLKYLQDTGDITRINRDYFLLTENYQNLLNIINDFQSKLFTVGEFGKSAGISRKYSIPLLEYWDEMELTVRESEGRRINSDKLSMMLMRVKG